MVSSDHSIQSNNSESSLFFWVILRQDWTLTENAKAGIELVLDDMDTIDTFVDQPKNYQQELNQSPNAQDGSYEY